MAEALLNVQMLKGIPYRDELGRYTSAQRQQYARNNEFAIYLREVVGRRIENHISFGKRASASTGRLVRASASKGNTYVTQDFVGIGRPDFLDHSDAKYWRTFEEGSLKAWGRSFIGDTVRPVHAGKDADGEGGGDRERSGFYGWSAHGEVPGIRSTNSPMKGGKFVVKQDIAPANIYADLQGTIDPGQFAANSARAFLARIFGEENITVAGPPTEAPSASQLYNNRRR